MSWKLRQVHLLVTFRCLFECDHCFVWGGPSQLGMMSGRDVDEILSQVNRVDSVEWIYFEGGEPFLCYSLLFESCVKASALGFQVGLVSNAYWAKSVGVGVAVLGPFKGLIRDLTISTDAYHSEKVPSQEALNACEAARQLQIPCELLRVTPPELQIAFPEVPGQMELRSVRYRGRAADALTEDAQKSPWFRFDACSSQDLSHPESVHVDVRGNVHLCQGILLGNLFCTELKELCRCYDPQGHPICGPLIRGGPAELVRSHDLSFVGDYADPCHLCYEARKQLRPRFPEILGPDQVYGVGNT